MTFCRELGVASVASRIWSTGCEGNGADGDLDFSIDLARLFSLERELDVLADHDANDERGGPGVPEGNPPGHFGLDLLVLHQQLPEVIHLLEALVADELALQLDSVGDFALEAERANRLGFGGGFFGVLGGIVEDKVGRRIGRVVICQLKRLLNDGAWTRNSPRPPMPGTSK